MHDEAECCASDKPLRYSEWHIVRYGKVLDFGSTSITGRKIPRNLKLVAPTLPLGRYPQKSLETFGGRSRLAASLRARQDPCRWSASSVGECTSDCISTSPMTTPCR